MCHTFDRGNPGVPTVPVNIGLSDVSTTASIRDVTTPNEPAVTTTSALLPTFRKEGACGVRPFFFKSALLHFPRTRLENKNPGISGDQT